MYGIIIKLMPHIFEVATNEPLDVIACLLKIKDVTAFYYSFDEDSDNVRCGTVDIKRETYSFTVHKIIK